MKKKMTTHQIHRLVAIAFCQPKFYKRSVWNAAKKLMDEVICPNRLAYPFDFGRGKGKYSSDLDIDVVKAKTVEVLRKDNLVLSQTGFVLVSSTNNKPALSHAIQDLPVREIKYQTYDDELKVANVYSTQSPLLNDDVQWIPTDDFICKCFVIDIAA